LRQALNPISNKIDKLSNDLKDDVNGLKDDVNDLKKDINAVKDDVNGLKDDMQNMKKSLEHIRRISSIVSRNVLIYHDYFNLNTRSFTIVRKVLVMTQPLRLCRSKMVTIPQNRQYVCFFYLTMVLV
jgi:outer membrane murein-binding lipoprotein Lpp